MVIRRPQHLYLFFVASGCYFNLSRKTSEFVAIRQASSFDNNISSGGIKVFSNVKNTHFLTLEKNSEKHNKPTFQHENYHSAQVDYLFPEKMVIERFPSIALMGQFNFAPQDPQHVLFWYQHWKSIFDTIIIRGPFNSSERAVMQSHGVEEIYEGRADSGHVSPIENLAFTLDQFRNRDPKSIDGVLYVHDDAFLNMSEISPGFANDDIIANSMWWTDRKNDFSYMDPRRVDDKEAISKFSFKIFPNATIINFAGEPFDHTSSRGQRKFYKSLRNWMWRSRDVCVPSHIKLSNDPRMDPYREKSDGSIVISPYVQADFLYVPMKYAEEFGDIAKLFVEYGVFLECAMGTMVDMLRRTAGAKIRRISLCSHWTKKRGKPSMIKKCFNEQEIQNGPYGMYHPIKLGYDLEVWGDFFDHIKLGKLPESAIPKRMRPDSSNLTMQASRI